MFVQIDDAIWSQTRRIKTQENVARSLQELLVFATVEQLQLEQTHTVSFTVSFVRLRLEA